MIKVKLRPVFMITAMLLCFQPLVLAGGGSEGGPPGGESMTHRMMVLALQLGTVLFVAKLSGSLFEKLRMPGVLGEIAGGVLIGPYLLGSISLPSLPYGLFPPGDGFPVSPELYGFCSIAAIVLLFDAGLETDVGLFMRYSLAGSMVGLGGVVVSFVLGDLCAVWFSSLLFQEPVSFMSPAALFLGVMSTATSVGITARILSDKGKIDSPEGVTILAGAVVDDVLGIIMLAVTMGIIAASKSTGSIDWGHIGVISLKAVGIWLAATVIGLIASHRISFILKLFKDRHTVAIMALGLGLILAGLFEEAGLAMIIGAYVMGLSLSRTDICHLIREKLEPISAFLVPVFFVVMGMLVDVRLIVSPKVLAFGAVYTLLASVSKIAGCAVPAYLSGFNIRGSLRIGAGMLPRGEVALIVAGIGLAAGAVGKEVFGVGMLMTLATTVAAPSLLIGLLKDGKPGSRRKAVHPEVQPVEFTLPAADTAQMLVSRVIDVFEDDGFFVHVIDRSAGIYQMRKEDSTVTLRRKGTNVIFDCSAKDRAFVYTAVFEVVSELRKIAHELAKPIDRASLAMDQSGSAVAPSRLSGSSSLAEIDPAVLNPDLKASDKKGIIEEMVRLAMKSGRISSFDDALKSVFDREMTGSTGMQYGIALPHGKSDSVDGMVCAVGLKAEGVDFDSLDGVPSRIFVLVLCPRSMHGPHIRFLSEVGQIMDAEGREQLLKCTTSRQMADLLGELWAGKRRPAKGGKPA